MTIATFSSADVETAIDAVGGFRTIQVMYRGKSREASGLFIGNMTVLEAKVFHLCKVIYGGGDSVTEAMAQSYAEAVVDQLNLLALLGIDSRTVKAADLEQYSDRITKLNEDRVTLAKDIAKPKVDDSDPWLD